MNDNDPTPFEDMRDLYGECQIGMHCWCLRQGWKGRKCPQWRPAGPSNYEELQEWFRDRVTRNRR